MLLAYPSCWKHRPNPEQWIEPARDQATPHGTPNRKALSGTLLSCIFNTVIEKKCAACLALGPHKIIVSINSFTSIMAYFVGSIAALRTPAFARRNILSEQKYLTTLCCAWTRLRHYKCLPHEASDQRVSNPTSTV
jgi:hypothetical protein